MQTIEQIRVHWAEVKRDASGEVRAWLGWQVREFSALSDAMAFAGAQRAAAQSGVCVMDADRNRMDS